MAGPNIYAMESHHDFPTRHFMARTEWLFVPEPDHEVVEVWCYAPNDPAPQAEPSQEIKTFDVHHFSLDHDIVTFDDLCVDMWGGFSPDVWVTLERKAKTGHSGGRAYLPVRRNIEL